LRSIFTRSFRGYLIVIVMLAVLTPILVFGTVRSRFTASAYAGLERTAQALAWTFTPLAGSPAAELDPVVEELGERLGIRITVISMDGEVLGDSERDPGDMENHRTRPEVIGAFNGRTGLSTRFSETLGQEMLYAAVPLVIGDSIPAVVRTSLFFSDLSSTLVRMGLDMAIVASVLLAAGLMAAWLFSRSISEPIRSIADVTRKVQEGDFNARSAPCSIRELDGLSGDINAMIARTRELVDDLSSESAGREAILTAIQEGLAVVDSQGRMVSVNPSFLEMACRGNRTGTDREVNFVSVPAFREHIRSVLDGMDPAGRVESDGRVFAASHSPVSGTDRTVFTFRDITELDNLVTIKRDFAANVSHELRTPLTSIKGYAETLLDGAGDENRSHLEKILRNSDRVIRLIDDIRVLSELEHREGTPISEAVDPGQVIRRMVEAAGSQAADKGLELCMELDEGLPVITADRSGMEQVLANLLENAIRYTSSGRVTVRAAVRSRFLTIVVSDTGIGIEPDHLQRVFERFFVVNRARSRERGGTGLGLSIVKHIMSMHGGWVKVMSTPGAGSMFTVAFPLDAAAKGTGSSTP